MHYIIGFVQKVIKIPYKTSRDEGFGPESWEAVDLSVSLQRTRRQGSVAFSLFIAGISFPFYFKCDLSNAVL